MIQGFDLPVSVSGYDAGASLANTKSDKKMVGDKIKFIVLEKIGQATIDMTFSDQELLEGIQVLLTDE